MPVPFVGPYPRARAPVEVPLSRQLPQYCPRRVIIEETRDPYGSQLMTWKVTIGGKSAELTFDEMLGCVASYAAPRGLGHFPMFWGCFKSDAEREYEDRIRESHWKLWHLGCLKPNPAEVAW
jgi:hypothetical protein